MADGLSLNDEITRQPPVRVYSDGNCRFSTTSKMNDRPHYLHSPVIIKTPATQPPQLLHPQVSSKPCPKSRPHTSTWIVGGPGMQAVFLDSGQNSFGTGVFLPRGSGTGPEPAKKPALISPVLLPSRVVQALNLNVKELGLQIKPRDCKNNLKEGVDRTISRKKKASDVTRKHSCVISQNGSPSPDIFLPKEWTY